MVRKIELILGIYIYIYILLEIKSQDLYPIIILMKYQILYQATIFIYLIRV